MDREDEKRIAAMMAKTLAMMCVRNTGLETLHAGIVPVTHAGDYSDVRVIDADGREISWNDVSHLDDDQIRPGRTLPNAPIMSHRQEQFEVSSVK